MRTFTTAIVVFATAACASDVTTPGPAPDATVQAVFSANKLRQLPQLVQTYYRDFIPHAPSITKTIWKECAKSGQVSETGASYALGVNCRLAVIDGYPRRFVVYVPPGLSRNMPVPIVLMHHGSSGSGEQFYNISGWVELADTAKFIAVFPSGLKYFVNSSGRPSTKWQSYNLEAEVDLSWRPPDYPATAPWPARDVEFISAVLDDLERRMQIDRRRIFASGFSVGSAFTARLSVELSDRLAAVGQFAGGLTDAHTPHANIPVAWLVGSRDEKMLGTINAQLLPGQPELTSLPLNATALLSLAAIQTGVEATLATFALDNSPTSILENAKSVRIAWRTPLLGNPDDNVFGYGVLDGVIHHYPHLGSPKKKNPNGFSAAELFWEFFRRHPRT